MARNEITDEAAFEAEFDEIMSGLEADSPESEEQVSAGSETEATPEAPEDEDVSQFKAMSPEDQAAAFEAMQRKLDVLGGYVSQQYNQPRQQQPQPAPQQYYQQPQPQPDQTPYLVTSDQIAPIAQQLQHMQRAQVQNLWNQEATNYKQAEANLREKYPDFDAVVPEHERVKAFDGFAAQGRYGNNWQQRFEYVYKAFAYDKLAAQQDEMKAKRDQKRAVTTRAAASVPPSGSVFQAPEVKLDRSKRGYRDAISATSEALKAL